MSLSRVQTFLFSSLQDFLVTLAFSSVWLVSSIAWAKTLSSVKAATDVNQILLLMSACRAQENLCEVLQEPVWTNLNMSVVSR